MIRLIPLAIGCIFALQSFFSFAFASELSDNYPLEKVVVLSRHNLRAPLASPDSIISQITPHTWFSWTSRSGELSLKGGEIETLMGQYFRLWLEEEKLIPINYEPAFGEVRFYSNSFQRTIATAQYFSSGMLPVANVHIEHHLGLNESDPVFILARQLPINDDNFLRKSEEELSAMGGTKAIGEGAANAVALVENVLDFKTSKYAEENNITTFPTDDITLTLDKTYRFDGSIRPAMKAADALVLQYYEEPDATKAAFGHQLTDEEWTEIGRLKELSLHTIYRMPSISTVIAQPLLEVMLNELRLDGRKFTFLCGHDTNLCSILSSLSVEDYSLPNTIEPDTPIGAKLVIEKRRGTDGQAYASLSLVYQSTEQIRNREMLSLDHPPMIVPLRLKGLYANEDGLYLFSELEKRFSDALEKY